MIAFLKKVFKPKNGVIQTAKHLVDLLGVKITYTTLANEMEEHPDFPNFISISDVLNTYGIENLIVTFDGDKLDNLPTPFLASIRGNTNSSDLLTVVKSISNNNILFFDPEKIKWISLSKSEFLGIFIGEVMYLEVREFAGEKDYDEKIKKENQQNFFQKVIVSFIPCIVLLASVSAFIQFGTNAIIPFIFLLLTLTGSTISIVLLWYQIDQYNPAFQQICRSGKKVNCNAVLQSKASKIAGISWSAIGFTFFTGLLLFQLFSGVANPIALYVASWLNVLTLPYIIFSIYYQWNITKQWCVLCLCVQGLLVLQLITSLLGGWHSLFSLKVINVQLILMIAMEFGIPFIGVTLLTHALEKAKDSKINKRDLQRLKRNPAIFGAMLSKQKVVTAPTEGLGITLGNKNAKYKLVKVSNPYCEPCARAHRYVEELLENNPDEIQVQIIYVVTNDEENINTLPVEHLLAIAEKNNEKQTRQALNDWYLPNKKDYEVFEAKYPMNGELKRQRNKIEMMYTWCFNMRITSTPTFFVNGHQLPEIYSISDLKYLLTL